MCIRDSHGRGQCGRLHAACPASPVSVAAVHIDEVDACAVFATDSVDNLADRGRGAALAADHLAEIFGMDANLIQKPVATLFGLDVHVVGVFDNAPDDVFDHFGNQGQAFLASLAGAFSALDSSALGSVALASLAGAASAGAFSALGSAALASAAGAFSALGSVAFLAALFFVTASALGSLCISLSASLKASALSRFGAANSSVRSCFSPLKVSQSPVSLSSATTASVGCAPTPSQYCARSETTVMTDGSALGL